ncbi:MAG: Asp-tRNA(Asn)/Glu-tRNA(Gln) amidotransferase subunit GatA [Candidatus Lokiarchaeota archaeon]|nr:Asp-tRNA(Asn)/Glu-tRNA(Gln) amidotransferase subunit GatA [Candidatus Lokiarchaeota archaeon]
MDYFNLTAHELLDLIKNDGLAITEIIQSMFERIEKVEDKIKGFISLRKEKALIEAEKLQKINNKKGKLFGIPIAIKDNMNVFETATTCGSKILKNYISPYDATVIDRIKKENGIIIGKTSMDEFAMGSSTESCYYGVTHNPWDLDHVPGGSSGGSAAVIAANESILALGSDTGGSVRCPASFCGISGIKTTYGLISRYGLVSYACSLEQIGPLTKDIEDLALLLNVIVGYDEMDSTTINQKHPDYLTFLKEDMKGLKLGIPKEFFGEGIDKEVSKIIWNAIDTYEKLGATYEELSIEHLEHALPCYYIIAMCECSSNLARFDGMRYGLRLEDAGEFNKVYSDIRAEGFGAEVRRRIMLGTFALSSGYYDAYYLKALKVRTLIKETFQKLFKKCDLLVTPTMPTPAFKIGEKISDPLSMYLADICTVPINIAGVPAISIPAGFSKKGLPIGLQLIGDYFMEGKIIQAAYGFQKNTNFHLKKPELN